MCVETEEEMDEVGKETQKQEKVHGEVMERIEEEVQKVDKEEMEEV